MLRTGIGIKWLVLNDNFGTNRFLSFLRSLDYYKKLKSIGILALDEPNVLPFNDAAEVGTFDDEGPISLWVLLWPFSTGWRGFLPFF